MGRYSKKISQQFADIEGAAFALSNALILLQLVELRMEHGSASGQQNLLRPGLEDLERAVSKVNQVQSWLASFVASDGDGAVEEKIQKFTYTSRKEPRNVRGEKTLRKSSEN